MESAELADRAQFELATSLLMASLRESRALNRSIREALQRREQTDIAEPPEPADRSSSTVFEILSDIIGGAARP